MILRISSSARQRLLVIWERIRKDSSEQRADKVVERLLFRASEL